MEIADVFSTSQGIVGGCVNRRMFELGNDDDDDDDDEDDDDVLLSLIDLSNET